MKNKNIILLSSFFFIASCSRCKNAYYMTVDLKAREPICKCALFIEYYHTMSGVSTYLTDSTSFRKYTGTYNDEQGAISFDCKGDSIIVEKSKRDPGYVIGSFVPERTDTYSLKELRKNRHFD